MAETSVDEAEKCSLNRRKNNDTASAKEQSMKAPDSECVWETRLDEEEKRQKSASMRGRHRCGWKKESKEGGRGMNFDAVQVDLQKIRDQETQGVCWVSLRPTSNVIEAQVISCGR